jgi:DNA replication protein DnaC
MVTDRDEGARMLFELGIVDSPNFSEVVERLPDAVEVVPAVRDWKTPAGFPVKYHECDFANIPDSVKELSRRWFMTGDHHLTLTGDVGTGKTWTACAIAYQIRGRQKMIVRFTTTPDIIDIFRACSMGDEKAIGKKMLLMACDLLVLDDVGANRTNDFALEELYNIVNRGKRTIITTNFSKEEMGERIDCRISSRLWGGHVVEWNKQDRRAEGVEGRTIKL